MSHNACQARSLTPRWAAKYGKSAEKREAHFVSIRAIDAESTETPRFSTMGKLFDTIRRLVEDENYVVGQHAAERLEERGIMEWQAVDGLHNGELISETPRAEPNPAIEVDELLPDGTSFKAVWSLLRESGVAKLVTVHFFD
jgi:hypothetical protein